jgi:hypothetical protein
MTYCMTDRGVVDPIGPGGVANDESQITCAAWPAKDAGLQPGGADLGAGTLDVRVAGAEPGEVALDAADAGGADDGEAWADLLTPAEFWEGSTAPDMNTTEMRQRWFQGSVDKTYKKIAELQQEANACWASALEWLQDDDPLAYDLNTPAFPLRPDDIKDIVPCRIRSDFWQRGVFRCLPDPVQTQLHLTVDWWNAAVADRPTFPLLSVVLPYLVQALLFGFRNADYIDQQIMESAGYGEYDLPDSAFNLYGNLLFYTRDEPEREKARQAAVREEQKRLAKEKRQREKQRKQDELRELEDDGLLFGDGEGIGESIYWLVATLSATSL